MPCGRPSTHIETFGQQVAELFRDGPLRLLARVVFPLLRLAHMVIRWLAAFSEKKNQSWLKYLEEGKVVPIAPHAHPVDAGKFALATTHRDGGRDTPRSYPDIPGMRTLTL